MTPLAPQRYGFQFTGDQETRVLYEDVRDLLSHRIPSGEMALVFKHALQLAKAELQKRKYAATGRPGCSRGSKSARHIPAETRREATSATKAVARSSARAASAATRATCWSSSTM